MLLAVALAVIAVNRAQAATVPPATTEGTWNGSPGSVPAGAQPDVLNDYLYYGAAFPSSFAAAAEARGATALVEMEPWQGGGTSDCSSLHGSDSYYQGIGSAIAAGGKPVILTWAHEFAVSGQYPWATGNGCGFTTADWIAGWKQVVTDVRATAGGLAYFMWAPNADTCPGQSCSTHDPSPWWPGASYVDMTGVDGYPAFCDCGTFAKLFAPTFAEIRAIPGFNTIPQTRIFIAETDLAPLDGAGYESLSGFIADLCAAGGDGVLQFQDGTPPLSGTQWSELNSALAACTASGGGTPTPTPTPTTPTPTPTATSPSPTPTPTSTGTGTGGTAVAFDAAAGARAANSASLSWTQAVGTGADRALLADLTIGTGNDTGCAPSATYDGIAMTEVTAVHTNGGRSGAIVVFGLVNPPSGNDTVHVAVAHCNGGTPVAITGGSEDFTGVSQSAPWGAHAVAAGNSAQSLVSVASAAGDLAGEFTASGSQVGAPVSPVRAQFTENQTNATEAGDTAGGYAPGSATVTGGWSLWNDWWGAAAVDVQHA